MPKRQFLETFCFYKVSSHKLTKHQFTFYQKHRRKLRKELTRRGGKEDLPHHSPSPSPPSIRKGTWAKRVKGDAIRPWDDSKTAIASSAKKGHAMVRQEKTAEDLPETAWNRGNEGFGCREEGANVAEKGIEGVLRKVRMFAGKNAELSTAKCGTSC